ncbi:MAG: sigma-70 family RNA polymerase sigma factor [Saprospiraceae bacterium]|nr:sigma-70 family RNA polymerase sigma factor [Saprospiraceae bacterium]
MNHAQQLIDDIRVGKSSSLETLYIGERAAFLAWAQKHFQCQASDAKELYQVCILVTYDNIIQGKLIKINCAVRSYLCAVAKNKWKELQRAKMKTRNLDQDQLMQIIDEQDHCPYPEQMVNQLTKGLSRLGNACQKVLEAFYYQKFSMMEICENLGYKNADTAKNLKYKCLQRLKKIMDYHTTTSNDVSQVLNK